MKSQLVALGLTQGEAAVYLSLLKLGPSTNSPLAKHTGLQSSSVYYCLNSLVEKVFVSYIQKGGRKHFQAAAPENSLTLLDKRIAQATREKKMAEQLLPKLHALGEASQGTTAEVYERFNGFTMVFSQILRTLRKGDGYEAFVVEQTLGEPKQLQRIFTKHNKALKAKGIRLRLLAHKRMKSTFERIYGKRFLSSFQEIRYTNAVTPTGITIYRKTVVTHVSENDRPLLFLMRNEKLAETYRAFFNSLWKKARP